MIMNDETEIIRKKQWCLFTTIQKRETIYMKIDSLDEQQLAGNMALDFPKAKPEV
jgi:hypothetical protein